REDLAAVHELEALGRDVHRLRKKRIADGVGLRRGGELPRLLRDGSLVDAKQRLARCAVQDVDPARLGDLRQSVPYLALVRRIEQHDRIWRIVVPDVVVYLLEMPATFTRFHLEGDDRAGEEIVARTARTAVVGPGVARRE